MREHGTANGQGPPAVSVDGLYIGNATVYEAGTAECVAIQIQAPFTNGTKCTLTAEDLVIELLDATGEPCARVPMQLADAGTETLIRPGYSMTLHYQECRSHIPTQWTGHEVLRQRRELESSKLQTVEQQLGDTAQTVDVWDARAVVFQEHEQSEVTGTIRTALK